MAKNPLAGEQRRAKLLHAGALLAAAYGAVNVTRRMVAAKGGVSEALVSSYFGTTAEAQKLYRKQLKKLGMSEPEKAKIELHGTKLRAHKKNDKRDARPRSVREVKAIKDRQRGPAEKAAIKKNVILKRKITIGKDAIVLPPMSKAAKNIVPKAAAKGVRAAKKSAGQSVVAASSAAPSVSKRAEPSIRKRGNIVTVKTRKSGGDARDVSPDLIRAVVDGTNSIALAGLQSEGVKVTAARKPKAPPAHPVAVD